MAVDWTCYHGLPEAPAVPEWRDTPEREAYWREREALPDCCNGRAGCLILLVLDGLMTGAVGWVLGMNYKGKGIFDNVTDIADLTVLLLPTALEMLIPAAVLWFVLMRLWKLWRLVCLARRHGFWMWHLRRPDVSREIAAILEPRPPFDRAAFRAMWPSPQLAECAEKLLGTAAAHWRLSGKMLYPNDPLLLFFFGRRFRWSRSQMIEPPGEFWDDLIYDFHASEALATIDKSSTLAELVECLAGGNAGENARPARVG